MNRTCKAAVAALILAVGIAGSVAAGPFEDRAEARKRAAGWRPKMANAAPPEAERTAVGPYRLSQLDPDAQPPPAAPPPFRPRSGGLMDRLCALDPDEPVGGLAGPLPAPTLATAGSVAAVTFEDAVATYKRGDYATALRLLGPLADQGNARAQLLLGTMYDQGLGVRPRRRRDGECRDRSGRGRESYRARA
jgi:hypothetical protein